MINQAGLKTIVKAKPYSGASKPIESKFALLIQHVFSQMPGYVRSDRTNKKSEKLGRKTKPYPGSYETFAEDVRIRILDLESQPIGSGPLAGRSPRQVFEDHVAAGTYHRVGVDPLALDSTFATFIMPKVDRGTVRIRGGVYRHPDLPNGRRISVALSFRRGAVPLAKIPGGDWIALQEDMPFAPWANDGAIEAKRIQSRDRKRVAQMRSVTLRPDLDGNIACRVGAEPVRLRTAAAPNPIMDVIAASQAEEVAAAWRKGREAEAVRPSLIEERVAQQNRMAELLEKTYGTRRG